MDTETEQRLRLQLQLSSPPDHAGVVTASTQRSPILHFDAIDDDDLNTNDLIWMEDRPNVSVSSLSPLGLQLRTPQRNAASSFFPSLWSRHDHPQQQQQPQTTTTSSTTANHQLVVMSRQVWEMTGHWINMLQREMEELEQDGILGHAIIRACHELADTLAHLTTQLQDYQRQHQRHENDQLIPNTTRTSSTRRNTNKNDFFEQSVNSLLLLQMEEVHTTYTTTAVTDWNKNHAIYDIPDVLLENIDTTAAQRNPNVDDDHHHHHDIDMANIDPLPPVIDLLQDMEQALRNMDETEANDLAEAAITVGHLLVAAMQQVHAQLPMSDYVHDTDDDDSTSTNRHRGIPPLQESPHITRLNENDDGTDETIQPKVTPSLLLSTTTTSTTVPPYKPYAPKRVRCLWPPLQPVAQHIIQYTHQEVIQKQPIYITAPILLTGWPILVTTTIIGSGIVVTDNALQHLYHHIQDHPVVVTSEMSMASLLQTMKLGYLTSKAVAKPTLRVVQKQIQRHAPQVQESVLYHIHHPIETIHSTVQTLSWCGQQVVQAVGHSWHEWQQQQQYADAAPLDDTMSVHGAMVDSDPTSVTSTTMLQHMSI